MRFERGAAGRKGERLPRHPARSRSRQRRVHQWRRAGRQAPGEGGCYRCNARPAARAIGDQGVRLRRRERHIKRQHEIIAALGRDRHDTQRARELLGLFEELQTVHIAHRDRLAKELAERSARLPIQREERNEEPYRPDEPSSSREGTQTTRLPPLRSSAARGDRISPIVFSLPSEGLAWRP
jgi:hypothetical protein